MPIASVFVRCTALLPLLSGLLLAAGCAVAPAPPTVVAGPSGVPLDAVPTDSRNKGMAVLLSSPSQGVVEMEASNGTWAVTRQWTPGAQLPEGVYGTALYGGADEILLMIHSQGVLRLKSGTRDWIEPQALGPRPLMVQMAVDRVGRLWVGTGATFASPQGGALHVLRSGLPAAPRFGMLDRAAQPAGSMLFMDDQSAWFATRAGVVRADAAAQKLERLSTDRVFTLFRSEASGEVAAVGATVQRWTKQKGFEPVVFGIATQAMPDPPRIGHPIDVVIDDQGRWTILFSTGRIVLLDAQRRFQALLGPDDKIPPSSRKLLHLGGNAIMVGTGHEGVVVLKR